ncbi:hypothetical protein EV192_105228 [Actinocrispum wychmicini]|uniref:Uncharacterized protein n=1 Tax=Actinocrispum wychmicini TaxID=1213861 RepID=A0A4R2JEQ7_9PSEU|nr:hypothetical protein EV192_105228 [Actinocrispum wychmicini]
MATSTSVRWTASGVRSSCEAFATNLVWLSNAVASRSSMVSNVLASSLSSSSGPSMLIRRLRFSAPSRRAVAVIECTGRSTRPAMYHAATVAITPAMIRATNDVHTIVDTVEVR